MKGPIKAIAAGICALAVLLCVLAGLIVERTPRVPPAPVPVAEDVRAAVQLAELANSLVQARQPVKVTIPISQFEAVHRLVGYAKNNVATDARLDEKGMSLRFSKRVAAHGWINIMIRLDQRRDGGVPRFSMHLGNLRMPDFATRAFLRFGLPLLKGRDAVPITFPGMISRFQVQGQEVVMTARLPKPVIGAVQAILSPGRGAFADMSYARALYGDLLAFSLTHPDVAYPILIRRVAGQIHDRDGLRAAIVALTLYVDGPRVRRLGGERDATPPCALAPQPVRLQGREDLPKHWTISAALALFLDARPARAIGLWKEMDDSLPGGDGVAGGTGFSFVDLGADFGGVALGKAARDGSAINKVLAALRSGRDDVILPPAILRLSDGMPREQYKRRFGGLDQPPMLAAEAGLRGLLRQSPLYRPLLPQ